MNTSLTQEQKNLSKLLQWFHLLSTWQQLLQTPHQKYVIITFKNPTDVISVPGELLTYYSHDPKTKINQWYPFSLADHHNPLKMVWILFKSDMCALNNMDPNYVPDHIMNIPFVDPEAPDETWEQLGNTSSEYEESEDNSE